MAGEGLAEPAPGRPVTGVDVGDHELGKTRLLADRCHTCILRPGGITLAPGRLRHFLADVLARQSFVVCHSTLPQLAPPGVKPAICRGFADHYDTPALRLIRTLWGFVEVPPPPKPQPKETL